MRKISILFLPVFIVININMYTLAEAVPKPPEGSREELYQDLFITLLSPYIDQPINKYYSKIINITPMVYPYDVDIISAKRVLEGRSFLFLVTLEVTPVVGPHISVGKDRLTFKIGSGEGIGQQAKLIQFNHLETHELPPNWEHILRKSNVSVKGDSLAAIAVIQKYILDLDANQWNKIPNRWVEDQRQELIDFINDKRNLTNKRGFLNIKDAELMMLKELPYEYGKQFLPNKYFDKFNNPKVFYVGVHYKVHKQNQFFIDGVNYFLIEMVIEDGEWKIALTPHVPVTSIIFDGHGFGTENEKTFDKRRLDFQ
jgi:hypothetical protein